MRSVTPFLLPVLVLSLCSACGGTVGTTPEKATKDHDAAARFDAAQPPIPASPPPHECIPDCLFTALAQCLPPAPIACIAEPDEYGGYTLCDRASGRRFNSAQGPRGSTSRTLLVDGMVCFGVRRGGDPLPFAAWFEVMGFYGGAVADEFACGSATIVGRTLPDGGTVPAFQGTVPIVPFTPRAPQCADYNLDAWPMGCGSVTPGRCN